MKKSIFNLNKEELKKLNKEFQKTSYGYSYTMISIAGLIAAIVFLCCDLFTLIIDDMENLFLQICGSISVGVLFMSQLKYQEMLKKYYDETK